MAKAKRRVGIDFGLARIGLAVADASGTIAMPLPTVKCEKTTEKTVEKVLDAIRVHQKEWEYVVEAFVVGLPLMMSGKTGFLADEVKHFASVLETIAQTPVILWDERLTSVQAERSLKEANLTRKRRSKMVDAVSAVLILQSHLDHLNLPRG